MKKYLLQLLAVAFIAELATGCASAPSKFYSLNSTAKGDGTASPSFAILVGPVSIPAEVDRPQFTIQIAPNQVAIDEFNRWAEPLNDNIARVVANDLASLLGTPRVVSSASLVNFNPNYRVTIDIQKFESQPGKSAQLEAVWVIRKTAGNITLSGRTVVSEPVSSRGFAALAAAHSRALARVSGDIAAAIRADAAVKQ